MSEFRIDDLSAVPDAALLEAVNEAFADYAVPLNFDQVALDTMLRRRGFDASLSAGVFQGGRLLAFHLICRGAWDGRPVVYDAASGVVPAARNQRLSRQMFSWLAPRWRAAGMAQCRLEVMEENTMAQRSYEATGFKRVRQFDCLSLRNAGHVVVPDGLVLGSEESNVLPVGFADWLEDAPSWQNSVAAMAATPQRFLRISLEQDGQCRAAGLVNPASGEAPLFAVDPQWRRRGAGRALVAAMRQQSTLPLRFINLKTGGSAAALVRAMGAESLGGQWEMAWDLGQQSG
ncbi:hypothetical protein [Chitinimonas sp.]|uniref:GNAT family N-acetyltransferase n=1 Tax=Chitinimonas sp. TaxID=1934313 RepID=UPI0035AD7D8C